MFYQLFWNAPYAPTSSLERTMLHFDLRWISGSKGKTLAHEWRTRASWRCSVRYRANTTVFFLAEDASAKTDVAARAALNQCSERTPDVRRRFGIFLNLLFLGLLLVLLHVYFFHFLLPRFIRRFIARRRVCCPTSATPECALRTDWNYVIKEQTSHFFIAAHDSQGIVMQREGPKEKILGSKSYAYSSRWSFRTC